MRVDSFMETCKKIAGQQNRELSKGANGCLMIVINADLPLAPPSLSGLSGFWDASAALPGEAWPPWL